MDIRQVRLAFFCYHLRLPWQGNNWSPQISKTKKTKKKTIKLPGEGNLIELKRRRLASWRVWLARPALAVRFVLQICLKV